MRPPAGVHTPDWAFTAVLEGERNPLVAVSQTGRAGEVHTAMAGLQEWGLPWREVGSGGNGSPQQRRHLVEKLRHWRTGSSHPGDTPGPSQPKTTERHI